MFEAECSECNEIFSGEFKLKTHMCRVHVSNPSFEDYYMKNWFIRNSCISVFCKQQSKELALLYSENCVQNQVPVTIHYPPNLK